jgi:magnesium transporter
MPAPRTIRAVRILRGLGPEVDELLAADEFFWLDVQAPTAAELEELGRRFHLHRLAVEDSEEFGQRPKLDDYGETALLVAYGVDGDGELAEVHLHLSGSWMITVHHRPCPALATAAHRIEREAPHSEEEAIYRVLDALTDSFFPLLEAMDDQIDRLMDAMIDRPRADQRDELFRMRRRLVDLRRVVAPMRDVLARSDRIGALPGLEADEARDWLRDVYDHLLRIAETLDGYRDVLAGALDVYLSTVSNRLNQVMKQLTIISVIFLPLTFVTGFFGQNFGWLVRHIDTFERFLLLGGGSLAIAVGGMYWWFRRSGFLDR